MGEHQHHWHQAGQLSALDSGEPTQIRIANKMIALCWDGEEVFAISDICSHELAFLSDGILENGYVECPLHHARFNFRTGKVIAQPATGATPNHLESPNHPAALPAIPTYPTRLEGDIVWLGYPLKDQ